MLPVNTPERSEAIRKQIALDAQVELVGRYVDALLAPPAEKIVVKFDAKHNRLWVKAVATQAQLAEVLASAAATAQAGSRIRIVDRIRYEFSRFDDRMPGGYSALDDITLTFDNKGLCDLTLNLNGPLSQIDSIERSVEPFDEKTYFPPRPTYLATQPDVFEEIAKQGKAKRIKQRDEWITTGIILLTVAIVVIYSIYITR
jgi:hypothetical protein